LPFDYLPATSKFKKLAFVILYIAIINSTFLLNLTNHMNKPRVLSKAYVCIRSPALKAGVLNLMSTLRKIKLESVAITSEGGFVAICTVAMLT
jgi:hypothetical protein